MSNRQVMCVMVSFNPAMEGLKKSINSVLANGVNLVLVDNGSSNQGEIAKLTTNLEGVVFIPLPSNVGIATAQNRGVEYALEQQADFIWLSDQDSVYPEDFLGNMLFSIENLDQERRDKIGAIGPSFFDTNRGNIQPIVRLTPFFRQYPILPGLNNASHIIASGMLIPAQALREVGLKLDGLFIDWVDTEWCWRAISKGKSILVNGDVVMSHTLGDSYVNFLGQKLIIRSPFRHYFMVRNELNLAIYYRGLPLGARFEMIVRTIIRFLLIPLVAPNKKMSYLRIGAKGFLHGLVNKLGGFQ